VSSNVYNFTVTFQERILGLLWRDFSSYALYSNVIKPKYFETDVHIDICRMIGDYYKKYQQQPTYDALVEEVRVMCNKLKTKAPMYNKYMDCINNMSEMDLSDYAYVKDRVTEFGKRQALVEAVMNSADVIEKSGDYEIIRKIIDDALLVGSDISDLGLDYFDDIKGRIHLYETGDDDVQRFPTGISPELDRSMNGGLGRGEQGVVIAPPGVGKTITLINIGANAVRLGFNVAHYSFEMSDKQISRRYDRCFLDKNLDYIRENIPAVTEAIQNIAFHCKGNLIIKRYPTKGATVNDIRSNLTQLRIQKNFTPDVIIIDYPDIMKASVSYTEKRHVLESIYEDCRALATEFNCAVWVASQTNRTALSKKVITMEDLAEAFTGKAGTADFMVALCQTLEEKEDGIMRLFLAKQRDGKSSETIPIGIFYENMKMCDKVPPRVKSAGQFDEDGGEIKYSKEKKTPDSGGNGGMNQDRLKAGIAAGATVKKTYNNPPPTRPPSVSDKVPSKPTVIRRAVTLSQ